MKLDILYKNIYIGVASTATKRSKSYVILGDLGILQNPQD